jgi:hypothetical protein
MDTTSKSQRIRMERIMSLVAVLAMLAAAASSALASQAPGAAGNRRYLAEPYTATDCERLARTTTAEQRMTPPLAGLAALRNDRVGYDLWHPAAWSTVVFGNGEASMYLQPAQQNLQAHFSIQTFDSGKEISVQDLPALIERFDQGLREMPDTQVAWQSQWWSADYLGFEAQYTYHFGDTTTERWVRWLYAGTHVYFLTAEAPAGAEYDRLAPSFLAMMLTFRVDGQIDQMALNACLGAAL